MSNSATQKENIQIITHQRSALLSIYSKQIKYH